MNSRNTFISYIYQTVDGRTGQGSCSTNIEPTCWDDVLELQRQLLENNNNSENPEKFLSVVIVNFKAFSQQE